VIGAQANAFTAKTLARPIAAKVRLALPSKAEPQVTTTPDERTRRPAEPGDRHLVGMRCLGTIMTGTGAWPKIFDAAEPRNTSAMGPAAPDPRSSMSPNSQAMLLTASPQSVPVPLTTSRSRIGIFGPGLVELADRGVHDLARPPPNDEIFGGAFDRATDDGADGGKHRDAAHHRLLYQLKRCPPTDPAACRPPVVSKTFCAARNAAGSPVIVSVLTLSVSSASR
jgi:hypothetical protein